MKLNNQITKTLIVILFIFFGILQTQAQVSFKPGLRGGANFSHFTKGNYYYSNSNPNNVSYGTHTDFYQGIIPVFYSDGDSTDHTNVVFSLGATYTFDLK